MPGKLLLPTSFMTLTCLSTVHTRTPYLIRLSCFPGLWISLWFQEVSYTFPSFLIFMFFSQSLLRFPFPLFGPSNVGPSSAFHAQLIYLILHAFPV